jgi:hypothetical protein
VVAANDDRGPVADKLDNLTRAGSVINQIAQHPKLVAGLWERLQSLQIGMDIRNDRDPQNYSLNTPP